MVKVNAGATQETSYLLEGHFTTIELIVGTVVSKSSP